MNVLKKSAVAMQSPPGLPFVEVIQLLVGLHQEHHQALLGIRDDQEQHFRVLVQAQQEDRELFWSWIERGVWAGETPSTPAPPTHVPLQKMGPLDDPEAFVDLFERSVEACGWPEKDCPVRLIPLLSGEAQQLPVQNLLVYKDLKRAIIQRDGRTPEQHRQHFRSLGLGESGQPFMMAQQLRDACCRWLMADGSDVDNIINKVVLEQFIARLPRKTAQWVQCHQPTSLDQAIQLAEDQMVACPGVGEPLPLVSLSPPPSLSPSPSPSKPVPAPRSCGSFPVRPTLWWMSRPVTGLAAGQRAPPSGVRLAGAVPRAISLPPLSPRQSLDPLPATRVAGRPGPACWRCGDPGHFIDRCPDMAVGTLIRVVDTPQAARVQAGLYQIP